MSFDYEAIGQRIEAVMKTAVVPGLSIAIIDQGALAWSQAFGVANVSTGEPVTTETIFEAASLTKPVFAYWTLQLVEAGVLALDTPLVSYLPEAERISPRLFDISGQNKTFTFDYVVNETAVQQITLRHVLSHQPGFPNWTVPGNGLKTHLSPGQRFSYSGDGYHFLQKVLASLLASSPAERLSEAVLQPLGMTLTHPMGAGLEAYHVATGHDAQGQATEKWLSTEMYAAASLHATPSDYARFLLALMNPDTQNLAHLSKETLQAIFQPQVQVNDCTPSHFDWPRETVNLEPNLFWGLGWGIEQRDDGYCFWQWGDNGTFKAFVLGDLARKTAVVLMSNSYNAEAVWGDILAEMIDAPLASLDWLRRMNVYNKQKKGSE